MNAPATARLNKTINRAARRHEELGEEVAVVRQWLLLPVGSCYLGYLVIGQRVLRPARHRPLPLPLPIFRKASFVTHKTQLESARSACPPSRFIHSLPPPCRSWPLLSLSSLIVDLGSLTSGIWLLNHWPLSEMRRPQPVLSSLSNPLPVRIQFSSPLTIKASPGLLLIPGYLEPCQVELGANQPLASIPASGALRSIAPLDLHALIVFQH